MPLTTQEAFLLGVRWREDIPEQGRIHVKRVAAAFQEFDQHPGVFRDQADGVVGRIVPLSDGTVVGA